MVPMELRSHLCSQVCTGACQFEWRCSRPGRTPSLPSLTHGSESEPAGRHTAWQLDPCWNLLRESEHTEARRWTQEARPGQGKCTSEGLTFTVSSPSAWKLFPLFSLTVVLLSISVLVGWFMTLISTGISVSVQSWHSTKTFSGAPTRNKLGATITFLQQRCRDERLEIAGVAVWNKLHCCTKAIEGLMRRIVLNLMITFLVQDVVINLWWLLVM